MTEYEIFDQLFEVSKLSTDPEGVVSACLVKDGQVLVAVPSADDGIRHAEDLVIEKAFAQNIIIDDTVTLYTTLEPCSYRSPINKVKDCTTIIIEAGIRNVIFGAPDPEYSKEARARFKQAGVKVTQTEDTNLVKKCVQIFNGTITIPLTSMGLPRAKKLL